MVLVRPRMASCYSFVTLHWSQIRGDNLGTAFKTMIRRTSLNRSGKKMLLPLNPDEHFTLPRDRPLIKLYSEVFYSLHDYRIKNDYGYNCAKSTNVATEMWPLLVIRVQ